MFRHKLLASAALLCVLVTGAAGCAGDGTTGRGGGSSTPSAAASKNPRDAAVEFAQCMREQGVEMADPGEDGVVVVDPGKNVSFDKVRRAQEACKDKAPRLDNGPGGKPDAATLERMLKFSRCMREHGIDMPDPDPDGGVRIDAKDSTIDPQSTRFQRAAQACREFMAPASETGGAR